MYARKCMWKKPEKISSTKNICQERYINWKQKSKSNRSIVRSYHSATPDNLYQIKMNIFFKIFIIFLKNLIMANHLRYYLLKRERLLVSNFFLLKFYRKCLNNLQYRQFQRLACHKVIWNCSIRNRFFSSLFHSSLYCGKHTLRLGARFTW